MALSRRHFLRSGAQVITGASLLGATRAITVKDVNGLALFSGAGCNVLGLTGADGALLVDGGLAENSSLLLKTVHGTFTTKRVHTLINTQWHPEQTGSNETVNKAGGMLVSHEVTKLFLGRVRSQCSKTTYGPHACSGRVEDDHL